MVLLNGVYLAGGDTEAESLGCLSVPPDGLGVPTVRTEDVVYPQRDGVVHFSDWYDPRIITLEEVTVCPDGCPGCPSGREKVQLISGAWSRYCDDTELVIFTDCHDADTAVTGTDRALVGPYGVVGRPRVAQLSYMQGRTGCATMLLRFDAVDHRLFVLDADGTPGSGEQCLTLTPAIASFCRTYPRCYPMCYDIDVSIPGSGPQETDNFGTLCAPVTITLPGALTNPTIENVTTGQSLTYEGVIPEGATVIINTEQGTATEDGIDRTYLLSGDPTLFLTPGLNTLRMTSMNPADTGEAEVCYRPAVVNG